MSNFPPAILCKTRTQYDNFRQSENNTELETNGGNNTTGSPICIKNYGNVYHCFSNFINENQIKSTTWNVIMF